jgi:nickel-dependent lactate racemase
MEQTMGESMTIKLPYGKTELEFSLPKENLLAILEPAHIAPAADPAAVIRQAIRNPVGKPALKSLVRDGQYVLVIIDDMTRPTPCWQLLPPILEEIEAGGKGLRIEILIATGTHRPMTPAEIEAKVGRSVMDKYPVINHEALDESSMVNLGRTINGTPIVVNRKLTEAGLIVALGNTVPHCLAGWAGGAKIVQPGVCGEETTNLTHALSMVSPMPHLGRLDNPMRVEIENIVQKVRLDFVINTVLNDRAELVAAVAGDSMLCQRQTVELSSEVWVRPIPALPDICIVSSYPADLDYWQGIKGLFAAEPIIKRGGDIILATPCWERISSNPHHVDAMTRMKGVPSKEIRHVGKREGIEDLAGLNTATVAARINELAFVQVISEGLCDHDLGVLGHARAQSIQEALTVAFERQGPDAKVLVITHGGDICPVLKTGLK